MIDKYLSFKKVSDGSMRAISGFTAYDEKLVDGKLICRYCNPCGQVMPEMHLPDALFAEDFDGVFTISVMGERLSSGWQLETQNFHPEESIMTFMHEKYPLRVCVKTTGDGYGWLSRTLSLENCGSEALALDYVMPLTGKIWRHRFEHPSENLRYRPGECGVSYERLYEVGYAPGCQWGQEGDFGFHSLTEGGLYFNGGMNGRSGWSRPAFVLRDNMNGQLFCCELAYSGNWSMEVVPQLKPEQTGLYFGIGIRAPEGEYVRVMEPGDRVNTPAVHFTLCAEGMEKLIQSRHHFFRERIMPPKDPIGSCLIEANHRGYLCDRENEADIMQDVSVAAKMGAELYVIDAGWYGREPNVWYNNAGDWFAGSWLPNDLHPIIEHVKHLGMKFGLWMEIEAAGENTKVHEEHPEFLMQRHGKVVCSGRALDFSNPEVISWVESEITRIITTYDLDMFRIDHNHWLNEGGTREVCGYVENVMWRYVENFYDMFERLNKKFPNVSFQNCAAGGGRLDLGILRYFHHTEVTDWVRPPRGARIFNGLVTQLPPEIQLRTFGTEVCEHVQDSDVIAQLHNVMQSRIIFRGIAPSLDELASPLAEVLQEKLRIYKSQLRPILTGKCKVFCHENQNGVFEPTPWSINEFALPDETAAFVVIQKLADCADSNLTIRLHGICPEKKYRLYCDRSRTKATMSGKELMYAGLPIRIDHTLGTELLIVNEI